MPCLKDICDYTVLYTVTILVSVTISRCKGIFGYFFSSALPSKEFSGRNCSKSGIQLGTLSLINNYTTDRVYRNLKACRFSSVVKKWLFFILKYIDYGD